MQGGDEELLEPCPEGLAVHGLVDHQGSGDGIAPQTGDEGGDLPMAMRDFADQALAAAATAAQPCHVGAGTGLVHKHQALGIELNLAILPCGARCGDVGAVLLAGVQTFF